MNNLTERLEQRRPVVVAVAVMALLLLLAYWGGFPQSVAVGTLALGLAFLIGVVLFFGFLVYWFYFSPLPEKQQRQLVTKTPTPLIRQLVGTGATIAAALITIGLFWDELWHRLYGVGEVVNDFWWRPHILLYMGMGINALFALGGMALIMQRGRGTMRQRFRSEPLVGLLTLAAGFQALTAPFDPLWHSIFGLDITAWSLPHLLLGMGLLTVMIVGSSIQFSLAERHPWRILGSVGLNEAVTIVMLMLAATVLFQFGTTEWEAIGPVFSSDYGLFQRPEWLYPVVIISMGVFIGMTALHLTRRVGAATLVFGLALALRLLLLAIFGAAEPPANMSFKTNVIILAPMIALDLWYAWRLRGGKIEAPTTWIGGSIALALTTFVIGLPLIGQLLYYPRLLPTVVIGMIVFGSLMAVIAGWAGQWLGSWLRRLGETESQTQTEALVNRRQVTWVGAGALLVALLFVAWFITTASPPVA